MEKEKNIFVSHYHEDASKIGDLRRILSDHGLKTKDSSVYEDKIPNQASNEDYIKSMLRPKIDWAGCVLVLIGKETHKSNFVDWEIDHAARKDKRIVGVYLWGEGESDLPDGFEERADALVHWNAEKIISAISGEDIWEAPERSWVGDRSEC